MQLVDGGPDIPTRILQAHEDGTLVFFCGSGISVPCGLPTYEGLVDQICGRLGASLEEPEKSARRSKSFDRVLSLLERQNRFGRERVREATNAILRSPSNPPLQTHRAILDLSRSRDGNTRLVTTNFDLLFEEADNTIEYHAAPRLPVPKRHKWDSVVYLHGRLGSPEDLVLSSADFGLAYLVEGWARRFVVELFRQFTVLLVGYQADDPVMRYLIDALAIERQHGQPTKLAYAFAPCTPSSVSRVQQDWEAKGIVPIVYRGAWKHRVLHRTIHEWASAWRGGLTSKVNQVQEIARKHPRNLTREYGERLCWALRDPSGAPARELAKLGLEAPTEWLAVLERDGLIDPLTRGPDLSLWSESSDSATSDDCVPPEVAQPLARWVASHAGNPSLIDWSLSNQFCLAPNLKYLIREQVIQSDDIVPCIRKIWLAITGDLPLRVVTEERRQYQLYQRLEGEPWDPQLRSAVLDMLSPRLAVRSVWRGDSDTLPQRVRQLVAMDCVLKAGDLREMLIERLRTREDWPAVLRDIALDLGILLRQAIHMFRSLEAASSIHDPSCVDHPSIEPHGQNRYFEGWESLIDLNREGRACLARSDPSLERALVRFWLATPFPVFRRLLIHSIALEGSFGAEEFLALVQKDSWNWLWSSEIQRELFGSLPRLVANLDDTARAQLVQIVLAGPDTGTIPLDIELIPQPSLDRLVWSRLARIDKLAPLDGNAARRLRSIESAHPDWRLTGSEKEDFSFWIETGAGLPTDFSAEQLLHLDDRELAHVLRTYTSNREGLMHAWRAAAGKDPDRAIRVLRRFLADGYLDSTVWASGLAVLYTVSEATVSEQLLTLVAEVPDGLLNDERVLRVVAFSLQSAARLVSSERQEVAETALDRLFEFALALPRSRTEVGAVAEAINHPTGALTEAVFHAMRLGDAEPGHGLTDEATTRLGTLIDSREESAALARVIIASRLPLLHRADPAWTKESVLTLFDWSNPELAAEAWQGYLWSPWADPSLWKAMKPHFLKTFEHLERLPSARELASLLAAVAMEGASFISLEECRQPLKLLDDTGRALVLSRVRQTLEASAEHAPNLWTERIEPWIEGAWPKELPMRDDRTSAELALLAMSAGSAFGRAVRAVEPLLTSTSQGFRILKRLTEGAFAESDTATSLALLAKLVPRDGTGWRGLGDFVKKVAATDSADLQSESYKLLADTCQRHAL